MNQFNMQNSKNEYNNFIVDEIIVNKEASHETGEYNEIQIVNGLIATIEEESSSSKDSTSKAMTISSSIGMVVGMVGIVIGTIVSISTSLNFLNTESIIGISQAQCFFELSNMNYDEVYIQLEDGSGQVIQLANLFPTDLNNQYVATFYDLSPHSTYYLQGLNDEGEEVSLGKNNFFTTLDIPHYDITIDTSAYDKSNEQYDLTFSIDNPNKYHIEALLICENDETLNQHLLAIDGIYSFTLPNILSSYRLELYQEDFLVGQTTFSDYMGIEIIDETIEIGISSIYMGLSPGEIYIDAINVSIVTNNNLSEVAGVEFALDGYDLFVTCYELEANTDYILKISDIARPSFTYFSYHFKTIPIPQYEITIDNSNFDIVNNVYNLTFHIHNPHNYLIDAHLNCLNDETLNDSFLITDNTLNITLPTLYSEYRLDLKQEEYDVGSFTFSYYTPMRVLSDTLLIESTTFNTEVDLGSVPIENISAFIRPRDGMGDELEVEIVPIENTSRISLRMEGLINNTSYFLEIRDNSRATLVYLNYAFETLA